jgi:hypothetical protein
MDAFLFIAPQKVASYLDTINRLVGVNLEKDGVLFAKVFHVGLNFFGHLSCGDGELERQTVTSYCHQSFAMRYGHLLEGVQRQKISSIHCFDDESDLR